MLLLRSLFDVSITLLPPILWVSLPRSKPASGTSRTIRGGEGGGKRYFHHNTVLTSQYNTTSSKVRTKDHYFHLWAKRLKHFKNIWLFQQILKIHQGWLEDRIRDNLFHLLAKKVVTLLMPYVSAKTEIPSVWLVGVLGTEPANWETMLILVPNWSWLEQRQEGNGWWK